MKQSREITQDGYRLQLDLSQQVLGLEIPEDDIYWPGDGQLYPMLSQVPGRRSNFVSAAVLAMKAKQFDDGLYAAVDLAAQNGAGQYPGKAVLLTKLAMTLAKADVGNETRVLAILFAACKLGGLEIAPPRPIEAAVNEEVTSFLADQLRSKPISFYTWRRDLESIFRQDRMLQTPMSSEAQDVKVLVDTLNANENLRDIYVRYLWLSARLTNPFTLPGLPIFGETEQAAKQPPSEMVSFFPPSRAHETDLIVKLYGDRPIPEGFDLMNELIARIRAGAIQLMPTKNSGWYDHQIWSIEPLVIPERMSEATRLQLDKRYREHLLELFKGIYALTRETHIKQLDDYVTSSGEEPIYIYISPDLGAEPLPTYYLRRALSYRFVRQVLTETFGSHAIRSLHRLSADGSCELDLAEELSQTETLFYGAHAKVSKQLGLPPDTAEGVGSGKGPEADAAWFEEWSKNQQADADLGRDARMMVPVFFDLERRKTKVWLFLGWSTKHLRISFATPPQVRIVGADGGWADAPIGNRSQRIRRRPTVEFTPAHEILACPVMAEVYVGEILNRDEFRRHCDKYKERSAILANLPGASPVRTCRTLQPAAPRAARLP